MLPTSTANNKDQNKGEMSTYKGTVPFWKGEVTGTGEKERDTDINSSLRTMQNKDTAAYPAKDTS